MKMNICVFPAQNECAVEINHALSNCENIEVYGVVPIKGHNVYNFKNYYSGVPSIEDAGFNDFFRNFLEEHEISVVFPTSDPVLVYLAGNKKQFPAVIVNGDLESAVVCNNKAKTYELFKDCDFCPAVYDSCTEFPCFIKPVDGEGARGTKLLGTKEDAAEVDIGEKDIILEYLPGEEMTVDCITDSKGRLRYVLPRTRDRIFAGMCVVGKVKRLHGTGTEHQQH